MKTPEEIAAEAMIALDLGGGTEGQPKTDADLDHAWRSGWLGGSDVPGLIAEAIRADRAQRFMQTSSSDRHARIRELLAEFDALPEPARQSLEIRMAEALRDALPPETIETPREIALRITENSTGDTVLEAVIAGMEAADQSWEPDDYAEPGTVAAALRRALLDRGDKAAADYVIEHEDEVWGELIGPMLDALQRDHGAPEADPWGPAAPAAKPRPFVWDAQTRELVRSDARLAIRDRTPAEYDENDDRL